MGVERTWTERSVVKMHEVHGMVACELIVHFFDSFRVFRALRG